jgi:hypothetical protein
LLRNVELEGQVLAWLEGWDRLTVIWRKIIGIDVRRFLDLKIDYEFSDTLPGATPVGIFAFRQAQRVLNSETKILKRAGHLAPVYNCSETGADKRPTDLTEGNQSDQYNDELTKLAHGSHLNVKST